MMLFIFYEVNKLRITGFYFVVRGFHYKKKKKKKKVRHKYVTVLFYVCSQQGDFSNI